MREFSIHRTSRLLAAACALLAALASVGCAPPHALEKAWHSELAASDALRSLPADALHAVRAPSRAGRVAYWVGEPPHPNTPVAGSPGKLFLQDGEGDPLRLPLSAQHLTWTSTPSFAWNGDRLIVKAESRGHDALWQLTEGPGGRWDAAPLPIASPRSRAVWSPDAELFAVIQLIWEQRETVGWTVLIGDADGEVVRSHSFLEGGHRETPAVAWSPDGTMLALLFGERLLVCDAATFETVAWAGPLAQGGSIAAQTPQWRADSRALAVQRGDCLYGFSLDTFEVAQYASEADVSKVAWVADTQLLLVVCEGEPAPMVWSRNGSPHWPVLVDTATGEELRLMSEAESFLCAGTGCDEGLSERVRRSFALWMQ